MIIGQQNERLKNWPFINTRREDIFQLNAEKEINSYSERGISALEDPIQTFTCKSPGNVNKG